MTSQKQTGLLVRYMEPIFRRDSAKQWYQIKHHNVTSSYKKNQFLSLYDVTEAEMGMLVLFFWY